MSEQQGSMRSTQHCGKMSRSVRPVSEHFKCPMTNRDEASQIHSGHINILQSGNLCTVQRQIILQGPCVLCLTVRTFRLLMACLMVDRCTVSPQYPSATWAWLCTSKAAKTIHQLMAYFVIAGEWSVLSAQVLPGHGAAQARAKPGCLGHAVLCH